MNDALRRKTQFVTALVMFVSILMEISQRTGVEDNPAADHCAKYVDDFLQKLDQEHRYAVATFINNVRTSVTKRAKDLDIAACLVGIVDVITTVFRVKPATEAAFIIDTLKRNRPHLDFGPRASNPEDVKRFMFIVKHELLNK
ncbi:hypothetical protein RCKICKAPOO_94 [Rhodobacter phage RcKickapoo]|nr:hypothetical protein RCKICKAPOO_94 [Rhodobacter phage RcKickapoo]UUV44461.1 hypothetical protein RCMENCHIE_92 [Rhodobacter phage RcMenchie]